VAFKIFTPLALSSFSTSAISIKLLLSHINTHTNVIFFFSPFSHFLIFSENNWENTRRFSELAGWEKFIDLLLWISSTFAVASEDQGEQEIQKISSDSSLSPLSEWTIRNTQMKEIFQVLFLMFDGSDIHGKPTQSVDRTLLQIVLDTFNMEIRQSRENNLARAYAKEENPELQIFVLRFFGSLLERCPRNSVIRFIFTQRQTWDILLGPFFLVLEEGDNPKRDKYLFRILEERLFHFIGGLCITLPWREGQNLEVTGGPFIALSILCRLIEEGKANDRIIWRIMSTLLLIWREKEEEMIKLFQSNNALSSIVIQSLQLYSDLLFFLSGKTFN